MLSCLKKLVYLTIVLSIGAYTVNFWLSKKSYIFKESDIVKVGKKYVDYKGSTEQLIEAVHKDFKALYPVDILPKEDVKMLFFGLGGFKGAMFLFHASVTEYLLIFGTPMETSGYGVRQWVNRTDVILAGETTLWKDGTLVPTTYKTGSTVYHEWGSEAITHYSAGMWKLSYGRGFVFGSLPHLTITFLFHSQDYHTFARMMVLYFKCIVSSCMQHFNVMSYFS